MEKVKIISGVETFEVDKDYIEKFKYVYKKPVEKINFGGEIHIKQIIEQYEQYEQINLTKMTNMDINGDREYYYVGVTSKVFNDLGFDYIKGISFLKDRIICVEKDIKVLKNSLLESINKNGKLQVSNFKLIKELRDIKKAGFFKRLKFLITGEI